MTWRWSRLSAFRLFFLFLPGTESADGLDELPAPRQDPVSFPAQFMATLGLLRTLASGHRSLFSPDVPTPFESLRVPDTWTTRLFFVGTVVFPVDFSLPFSSTSFVLSANTFDRPPSPSPSVCPTPSVVVMSLAVSVRVSLSSFPPSV